MQQAGDGDSRSEYGSLRSERALKDLYEAHGNRLFQVCLHIVGNRPEAEEVVQDVFTDIWLGKAVFRHQSSIKTWLYRVAVNKCLMLLRKRRMLRWLGLAAIKDSYLQVIEHTHALHDMIHKEELAQWHGIIQRLPDQQRIAFSCFYLHEMSYAETASAMKRSVSSVDALLVRARRNLQLWLTDQKPHGNRKSGG
jgi:RNA polymerase sigma-70 factor (ECF subfamily)